MATAEAVRAQLKGWKKAVQLQAHDRYKAPQSAGDKAKLRKEMADWKAQTEKMDQAIGTLKSTWPDDGEVLELVDDWRKQYRKYIDYRRAVEKQLRRGNEHEADTRSDEVVLSMPQQELEHGQGYDVSGLETDAKIAEAKNKAIKDIEVGVCAINAMAKETEALVAEQGQSLQSASGHVVEAQRNMQTGTADVKESRVIQQKSRKKMCCILALVVVVIIVVVIVVVKA